MGLFFYFLLLVFSLNAKALEPAELATKLGLKLAVQGKPLTFLGTHEIYSNETHSRQMFVVHDVPVVLKEVKVLRQKDYLILQLPGPKGHTSMALLGVSEEEVKTNLKTSSVWKKIWNHLNPIPSAYAETCSVAGSPQMGEMEQLGQLYGTPGMGPMDCLMPMIQGAWEATGGAVVSGVNSIANLAKDPRGWWDSKVEQFQNLKSFIDNFTVKMQELGATFLALPGEVKTMMMCMFAGSLGPDVLLSLLTGGAASAAVLLKVNSYLSKMIKLEKVLALLRRLGKLATMPADFFRKLARGDVTDSLLHSMDVFAHRNMDDLAVGAMSCGL